MTEQAKNLIVGFPLYEDVTLLDFVGATQVFAFAAGFEPIWLAETLAPVKTSEGMSVNPQYTFDSHPHIDVLFVPGGGPGVADAMQNAYIRKFVQEVAATSEWSGSVCTGAFILAAAGLFNGCNVTTYWSMLEVLGRFPELTVNTAEYPRYLVDSEKKRFSGGGVSSSIDLALQLVIQIKGKVEGTVIADKADLSIQYAPGPPVTSGDPSQAKPEIVASVKQAQLEPFIQPICCATDKVIAQQ